MCDECLCLDSISSVVFYVVVVCVVFKLFFDYGCVLCIDVRLVIMSCSVMVSGWVSAEVCCVSSAVS